MTIRTVEEIIDQMRASLVDDNSELANFPEYGNLYAIYRSVAAAIVEQDVKIDTVSSNLFLNSATGEALDAKGREFNIIRREGFPSTGGIIVLGSITSIPAGTILTDNQTGLQFTVISRIALTADRGVGTIECVEFTGLGNIEAGRELFSSLFPNIKFIIGTSYDPFLSVYRGGLIGGSERETDNQLKERIVTTLSTLSTSTVNALKLAALNINGVSKVNIVENDPGLGYITVYVNNSQKSILNQVKTILNNVKPVGVALQIKSFSIVSVDIDLTITSYNTTNTVNLNNQISSAIQTLFNNLNSGAVLSKEVIAGTVINIPNVINVAITNPTSNIEILSNEILTLNNLNITYK
jgi:uncharacterized phage protein gp47/JayE